MRQVAIIGGGPAGLAAAWTLARSGVQVTVYERRARPGGLLRTETLGGARVDVAVQLISSTHTSLLSILREAGAGGLVRRSPGRDALWRRGRAQSITYGSIPSMATSGALPTTLKLKLAARYLPYLNTQARGLDANDPAGGGGTGLDTESIADWGRRELGDEFVDVLVYPLLAAYYGALPSETLAPVYHALARVGMDVTVYAAAGGFGALADALMAALEENGVRFVPASEVSGIAEDEGGVHVEAKSGSAVFHAVVVAVPANRAAGLITANAEVTEWLRSVRVRSSFTVAYRTDRPHPGDYFGLSFPRGTDTGEHVAAMCVQSRKLPGLVPAGGDAVVALPSPDAMPSLIDRDDEQIADTMLAALERSLPRMSRHVTSAHVNRFDDAYTLFEAGHLRRLASFDHAALPPGVALAGSYLAAPSVEGAARSGVRAASRVLEMFGRPAAAG